MGWLRELLDAPKGSIASRLSVGSARDPHEEIACYGRPRTGGDLAHNIDSILCPQAVRVVIRDAADGARRRVTVAKAARRRVVVATMVNARARNDRCCWLRCIQKTAPSPGGE